MQRTLLFPLFEKTANVYKERDNPENFILDLLELDTPYLFIGSSDANLKSSSIDAFSNFLKKYIQYKRLENSLCNQILKELVSYYNFSLIIVKLKYHFNSEFSQK